MAIKHVNIFILLIFTLCLNSPVLAQEKLRIAAVVNDEIISIYDLESRLKMVLFSTGRNPSPQEKQRLIPQILRSLIDDKLKLQEAKRRNIKASEREVDRAYASI